MKKLCTVFDQVTWRLRCSDKRRYANIWRRPEAKHCSSLCLQSEGHEHVANIASALGHIFVGFLAVFGRHNIRPPHFASKVSYSASPQTFAACSRSTPCSGAATAILFGKKLRREFSGFLPPTLQKRLSTNLLDCLNFKRPPSSPFQPAISRMT